MQCHSELDTHSKINNLFKGAGFMLALFSQLSFIQMKLIMQLRPIQ